MVGMACYDTQAEAMHVAMNMCCNSTCCEGAHEMGCVWTFSAVALHSHLAGFIPFGLACRQIVGASPHNCVCTLLTNTALVR
jgi:hypothetical protein